MAFFEVLALALPFEINFFISCFVWFVVTEGNDKRNNFHDLRFLDGWQKKQDEWNDLIDERKKEKVKIASRVHMWKGSLASRVMVKRIKSGWETLL
jgi:hypothetical protein